MRRIVLLSLLFFCAVATAQVYKRTAPDGTVTFSDRPGPDAEKVEVRPAQTVRLPPVPQPSARSDRTSKKGDGGTFQYTKLAIASPTNEEGVRANDGNVTLRLVLQPALKQGHTLAVQIDGQEIGTGNSTTIQLTNLSRGAHTLTARVVDGQGKQLQQAEPVTFHVLRVAVGR